MVSKCWKYVESWSLWYNRSVAGLMWRYQLTVHGTLKRAVNNRLQEKCMQHNENIMNNSSKCILYKNITSKHKFEQYDLVKLSRTFYVLILKISSCNHRLVIERRRYSNIPSERRHCELCNEDRLNVGDQYRFLLQCSNNPLVKYRNHCIPHYYSCRPNSLKFKNWCNVWAKMEDWWSELAHIKKCVAST